MMMMMMTITGKVYKVDLDDSTGRKVCLAFIKHIKFPLQMPDS
jgi:hypothetical protein